MAEIYISSVSVMWLVGMCGVRNGDYKAVQ